MGKEQEAPKSLLCYPLLIVISAENLRSAYPFSYVFSLASTPYLL